MDLVSRITSKHSRLVVAISLTLAAICFFLFFGVRVNYALTDYLPDDSQSTKALELMEEEFSAIPNARVMLRGVSVVEALEYKTRLAGIEGVSGVIWLDDVQDIKVPLEVMDKGILDSYYKDGNALISLIMVKGSEAKTLDSIYELIGEDNAVSGEAINTATAQSMTGDEVRNAFFILVPIILLILILSTTSWLEPLLFGLTIGVAVILNLGTNFFMSEVSFITQAISPILQLAVSLDYAIFLLHSFSDFRKQTDNPAEAMRLAVKKSFSSIAASAATTFFGFIALSFMDFKIGADLGLNLVKGIAFSFLSVMVFLPALTLLTYKLLDKTRHRPLLPSFRGIGKPMLKLRYPLLILIAVIIIPAFFAQNKTSFTYGIGDLAAEARSGRDTIAINEVFGRSNTVALLVPNGDPASEQALTRDLEKLPFVNSIVSYANTVGTSIPEEFLDKSITENFHSKNYSRFIIYTNTPNEGDEAFAAAETIQETARSYYGEGIYSCGQNINLLDLKNIITKDNTRVNIIAIACIALVLIVTFRSPGKPIALVLTIESAIWINLAIPYFAGTSLCYVGYLVVSTVQLGATVDYAILLTNSYRSRRETMPALQAARAALGDSFFSILVSASILSSAGFTLYATSANEIITSIGLLLGRGTILSFALVVALLPGLLVLLDRFKINKKTRGAKS